MVDSIVKQTTLQDSGIYEILGINVFPTDLPDDVDKVITPSAIYSIINESEDVESRGGLDSYVVDVAFGIIVDTIDVKVKLMKKIIKAFKKIRGVYDEEELRILNVELIGGMDVPMKDKDLVAHDLLFRFKLQLI